MARNFLVFGGLALCVGAVVLWALTERRTRLVSWYSAGCNYALRADAGRLCFERMRFPARLLARQGGWSYRSPAGKGDDLVVHPADRTPRNGYGFELVRSRFGMAGLPASFTRLTVPFWPLVLLCLTPAAVARLLRRAAARRRHIAGRCLRCGYDLRASPDRCPECGSVARPTRPPHNPPMQRTGGNAIL